METFIPSTNAVGGSVLLSALVGIVPLILFFVLLGVFKIKTHWCALYSLIAALIIAVLGFSMPPTLAVLSASQGFAFGIFPIAYIIIAAVWLHNLTERSGRSADIRAVIAIIGHGDQRIQAFLIAFSFCGLLEGLAGFGAPIAISAAMLVTIGVKPIKAAAAALIGNAIHVGYGPVAIPIITAARLGGSDSLAVAHVMGHLSPYIAACVPLVILGVVDGRRGIQQLWLPALVAGSLTAFGQFICAVYFSFELTAVLSPLLGFLGVALLLSFWHPQIPEECRSESSQKLTFERGAMALVPYVLVLVVFAIAKLWRFKINLAEFVSSTDITFGWPMLHGKVLDEHGNAIEATRFQLQWLSSPGTLLLLTAIIVAALYAINSSGGRYPLPFREALKELGTTIYQLRIVIVTIVLAMGLAYVMNFSGQTAALGAWMAGIGTAFVFASPWLGWLGTAVSGSATSANALFGHLQSTAATQIGAEPDLLLSLNTIGGGLGKIISPQNLTIAAAAVGRFNTEPELLKKVTPASVGLVALLSVLGGLAYFGLLPL